MACVATIGRYGASRRTTRALGWLGAMSPQDAATKEFPSGTSSGFHTKWMPAILSCAEAGQLTYDLMGAAACESVTGSGVSNVQLAQMSTGLALTGINVAAVLSSTVAASIGTILGPLTMGVSAIIGLFPLIFGHHAAAVKKERSVLCPAFAAANNYLQVIQQGVDTGACTPQDAIAALESLQSDFRSTIASVTQDSGSTCNEGCLLNHGLAAIVDVKSSEYQDLITAAAVGTAAATPNQVVTASTPNTTAAAAVAPASSYASFYSSGTPAPAAPASSSNDWMWIAAAAVAAFFLAEAL